MHRCFIPESLEFTTGKEESSVKKFFRITLYGKIQEVLSYNAYQLFQTGKVQQLFHAQLGFNLIQEPTM